MTQPKLLVRVLRLGRVKHLGPPMVPVPHLGHCMVPVVRRAKHLGPILALVLHLAHCMVLGARTTCTQEAAMLAVVPLAQLVPMTLHHQACLGQGVLVMWRHWMRGQDAGGCLALD